jgi:hypothetical protein
LDSASEYVFFDGVVMSIQLEMDGNGNVITRPVTGWTTMPAAGIAVVLVIQYAEKPTDIENDTCKQLQCILLPQQALELAETLTRQAKRVMESTAGESVM